LILLVRALLLTDGSPLQASIASIAGFGVAALAIVLVLRRRQKQRRRGQYALKKRSHMFQKAADEEENTTWDEFVKSREKDLAQMQQKSMTRRQMSFKGAAEEPSGTGEEEIRSPGKAREGGASAYSWYRQGSRAGGEEGKLEAARRVAYIRRQQSRKLNKDVGRHGDKSRLAAGVRPSPARGSTSSYGSTEGATDSPSAAARSQIARPDRRLAGLRQSVQRMPSTKTINQQRARLRSSTGVKEEEAPLTGHSGDDRR